MDKTIVELFAGVGGFRCGFENLHSDWETVWFSQYEPSRKAQWAHDCYVSHFGDCADLNGEFHTGDDINLVDKTTIPNHSLLVGGFPCFIRGTKVFTEMGGKNIEDIVVGDKVLTHTGAFKTVLASQQTGYLQRVVKVISDDQSVICTPNHLFYVSFDEAGTSPFWLEAENLLTNMPIVYVRIVDSLKRVVWQAVDKVEHLTTLYDVYDITVEDDHSFIADGFTVHNCQDYSVARTKSSAMGIEGKKGVLWWQIRDVLEAKQPPFCMFENVDRLLKSPAKQRGRDFGIILACLNNLGYSVEWRVVNAANFGAAQKRRRIFIFAYKTDTKYAKSMNLFSTMDVATKEGLMARAFPVKTFDEFGKTISLGLDIAMISDTFAHEFCEAGVMRSGVVWSCNVEDDTEPFIPLRDILEKNADFKYDLKNIDKWRYLKGSKRIPRVGKSGHEYMYTEGAMSFPDNLDLPGRTMLTSEGTVNRSSHAVEDMGSGHLRILTPIEAERLQGFPDDWTKMMPEKMRYFCMGNALVVPMITRMGRILDDIISKE